MSKTQRGLLAILATLVLAWSGVAFAQEQVGAIEGIVADANGPLPGVTVEASALQGGKITAVTDANGMYRFPRVSAGTYKLTATLDGFVTSEAPEIRVALGKNSKVNFTMRPGTF